MSRFRKWPGLVIPKALLNNKGIAQVELLPLLVVFVALYGLTFGLWSSIHSGTLKSIGARHYAFEVLNNRSNYVYHRDTLPPDDETSYYREKGYRVFASVEHQSDDETESIPTKSMEGFKPKGGLSLFDDGNVKPEAGTTNPIKFYISYGICIDHNCGDIP